MFFTISHSKYGEDAVMVYIATEWFIVMESLILLVINYCKKKFYYANSVEDSFEFKKKVKVVFKMLGKTFNFF